MSLDDLKMWGEVHRDLPSKQLNSTNSPARLSQRGEWMVQCLTGNKLNGLADEGRYFVATNGTPGTGIAGHAAPTDITVDTKPFVHMRNDASSSTDTRVYLDFIDLQCTAAGTNNTDILWCAKLDTGATRRSSGGSALTAVNPNMAETVASSVTTYAGAVVAAAATASQRLLGAGLLRTVIPVVGDRYLWTFGDSEQNMSNMIVAGTAIANLKVGMPPVVLGPTDQFLLHLASTAQSGASSFQVRIGWYER